MKKNINKLNKSVNKSIYDNLMNRSINEPKVHFSNNLVSISIKNLQNNYLNMTKKTKSKSLDKTYNNSYIFYRAGDELTKKESSIIQKRPDIRRVKTYAYNRLKSTNTSTSPSPMCKSNKLKLPIKDESIRRKRAKSQKRQMRLSTKSNSFMNFSSPNIKKIALDISTVFVAKKKSVQYEKKMEVDNQKVVNLKMVGNELLLKIKDMQGNITQTPRQMQPFIAPKLNLKNKLQEDLSFPNSSIYSKTPKSSLRNKLSISIINNKNNITNIIEKDKYRFLEIKKQIYDSFGDNESEEETEEEGTVIYPNSFFIFILDSLIFIFTLFYSIYVPFIIADEVCFCNINNFSRGIIFYIIDILFIVDLCVSFFRAYYNFELKLIKSNYKIIIHYLTGNFFVDLLTAIPVYSISTYICENNNETIICYRYCIPDYLFYLEMLMNLKIMKIFKINNRNKNIALHYLLELSSDNFSIEKATNLINNVIFCLLFLHFFVCFNIFIAKQKYPNWLFLIKSADESLIYDYIASLYSLIQALTTVGYGDSVPQSNTERIFQILIIAVGDIAYSYLISYVGNTIKNNSHIILKFNNDVRILRNIRSNYPGMSNKLFKKIYRHLESRIKAEKKFDANLLINSLPFNFKNQIIYVMYSNVINNFTFFKKCENSDFIVKTLASFQPTIARKYEFLIYEGEMIDDIVLVKDGRLALEAAIDVENPYKSIENYLKKNFEGIDKKEEKKRFLAINNQLQQNISTNQITKKRKNYQIFKEELTKAIRTGTNILSGNEIDENEDDSSSEENSKMSNKVGYTIIGKIFGNAPIKNEDGNYKYLKIIDIRKNEHFGGLYMFLRRPAPLSLQVRTKMAEIYLLPKKDVFNISKSYPNIWKKIHKKDFHNMISIKYLTISTLKKYIKTNGLNNEGIANIGDVSPYLEKSKFLFQRNSQNSSSNASIGFDKKKYMLPRDSKDSEKSNNYSKRFINSNSIINKENFLINEKENALTQKDINKIDPEFKNSSPSNKSSVTKLTKKLSKAKNINQLYESFQASSKKIVSGHSKKNLNIDATGTVIISTNNNNNQQPKTLLNIMSEKSVEKKKKKMQRNKKLEKIIEYINLQQNIPQYLQMLENKGIPIGNLGRFFSSSNVYNLNNYYSRYSQNNILFQIQGIIEDEENLYPSSKTDNYEDLKQTSTSFSINSSYENINLITKGKYIKDEQLREKNKKFLIDNLIEENYDYNLSNYNENFSSISFNTSNNCFKDSLQKNRSNSESSKKSSSIKNCFNDNSSTFSDMLKIKPQKIDTLNKKICKSSEKLSKIKMIQNCKSDKNNFGFVFKNSPQNLNLEDSKSLNSSDVRKKFDKKSSIIKSKRKSIHKKNRKHYESAKKINSKDIKIPKAELRLTKSPKKVSKIKILQNYSKGTNFTSYTMKNLKVLNVKNAVNQESLVTKKNYKRVNTGNHELFSNVGSYINTKKDKDCLIY